MSVTTTFRANCVKNRLQYFLKSMQLQSQISLDISENLKNESRKETAAFKRTQFEQDCSYQGKN